MVAKDIVKYEDSVTHKEVVLGLDDVRRSICPTATEQEALNFLRLCQYMGLNPFVRDAYLIKYGDGPASMVVGKDAYSKRADAHPQFAGMESGVIVMSGDAAPIHRKGTLLLEKERLVGGWAKVARNDRKLDIETSVSFGEFDTGRAMWKKMPAIMIEKCAIVKALRNAFPSTFSGMYDSAEMGIDMTDDFEPDADSAPVVVPAGKPKRSRAKAIEAPEVDGPEMEDAPGFEDGLYDKPVVEAPESSPLVEAAQTMGAVVETADDVTVSNVVIQETTEIIQTLEGEEELVMSDGPPHCAEHNVDFEWRYNPDTEVGKYVHQIIIERNGEKKRTWCVAQDTA